MHIKKKASRENLSDLLSFVERACSRYKLTVNTCLDLQLAVEEACVNIIEHGYAGLHPGTIELTFQVRDQRVSIIIVDFGHKFDSRTYPPPDTSIDLDKRPVGGLGVFLITRLMDEVRYTSNQEQGNRLTLIKNIESIHGPTPGN
jgi:anti-sigma regulatory factor (Ser/Thr protein kinase)